jgi:hypothetical protein
LVCKFVSHPFDEIPSQSANGATHCSEHWPIVHSSTSFGSGELQGESHPPQCATSVCVSTQAAPHCVSAQLHLLATQWVPWGQALSQMPQLLSSVVTSVQNAPPPVPHATLVAMGQGVHPPASAASQSSFGVHTTPHCPQLFRSVVRSTQPPSQSVGQVPPSSVYVTSYVRQVAPAKSPKQRTT